MAGNDCERRRQSAPAPAKASALYRIIIAKRQQVRKRRGGTRYSFFSSNAFVIASRMDEGRFKMNPPLRSAADRDALIEGLLDGTIDCIATDHAPHSAEEKSGGLRKSAFGIVGLETAFPILYTQLVQTGIVPLELLLDRLCIRPRRIFGLPGGDVAEGAPADLTVLDLNRPHAIVSSTFKSMRHPKEGAPFAAVQRSEVPIINAGDGGHNHPTQTLTDLLTIHREKGRLSNFTIGFCGDLKFGRTVHSLVNALSRQSGIRFVFISPEELKLPGYLKENVLDKNGLPYTETDSLEDAIPSLDVLYMTRVQKERFFNEADYIRLKDTYVLDPEKLIPAKGDLCILHPLPRVNEIAVAVDNDPRACYFKQVKNGKFIRMGSDSDWPVVKGACRELEGFGIPYEAHILSAHRTPTQAAEFAKNARTNGFGVLICAAGMAAHLAGAFAGNCTLPVIGIPMTVIASKETADHALEALRAAYPIGEIVAGEEKVSLC